MSEVNIYELTWRNRKMYKAPKTIINHPAVLECDDAQENGFDYVSSGKLATYDVFLKANYRFDVDDRDRREMRFATVKEFLDEGVIKLLNEAEWEDENDDF